jgi:hypothetical protein
MKKNDFIEIVKPYTMTSEYRISALFDSLEYIRINEIEGDFVECGVWKGGNILGILKYLEYHNMMSSNIWLYDTFNGMTEASEFDIDHKNNSGKVWEGKCDATLDYVKNVVKLSDYSESKIKFVVGDICETLNFEKNIPNKIALLRLDTDWYSSTKKELEVLYPLLQKNGNLIIDDYGHWKGCKKAVDEYFQNKLKFEKIDYTGIKHIK